MTYIPRTDLMGVQEREEQFFKTCTWDQKAEEEYLEFEAQCRADFLKPEVDVAAQAA